MASNQLDVPWTPQRLGVLEASWSDALTTAKWQRLLILSLRPSRATYRRNFGRFYLHPCPFAHCSDYDYDLEKYMKSKIKSFAVQFSPFFPNSTMTTIPQTPPWITCLAPQVVNKAPRHLTRPSRDDMKIIQRFTVVLVSIWKETLNLTWWLWMTGQALHTYSKVNTQWATFVSANQSFTPFKIFHLIMRPSLIVKPAVRFMFALLWVTNHEPAACTGLVTSVMALLLRARPTLISGSNATEPYSAGKHMVT